MIETANGHENFSSSSSQTRPKTPDPTISNSDSEVLLELAEDCPLSPSILLTASPMEVNPAIVVPRLSKGKIRTRGGSIESKKRKSKIVSTINKPEITLVTATDVPVNQEDVDPLSLSSEEVVSG